MTIHITTASVVLAQLKARQQVKRELQKQGLKVSQYSAKEISSWARVFLEDHPQLFKEARETAERLTLEGAFGKRAQRALAQSRECSQSYKILNTSQT